MEDIEFIRFSQGDLDLQINLSREEFHSSKHTKYLIS